ncbi:ankyrin [Clavulina sp. PMI_390]|nr:ankyrin [Clavulina sp. PMI_390]
MPLVAHRGADPPRDRLSGLLQPACDTAVLPPHHPSAAQSVLMETSTDRGLPHPPSFNELWSEALANYQTITNQSLLDSGDAKELLTCSSIDDVENILKSRGLALKVFRKHGEGIRSAFKPLARVLQAAMDTASEVAAAAGVPGGRGIFVAIARLLQAVDGVSKVYDDLGRLLSKLQTFLTRLEGHITSQAINQALRDVSIRTLVQLMNIIALFIKFSPDKEKKLSILLNVFTRRMKDYGSTAFGNAEVQEALTRLDEILNEETLTTIARTLDVVTAINTKSDLLVNKQLDAEIRGWLDAPDPSTNHEQRSTSGSRVPGHADWFLNGENFQDWLVRKRGFFWVWAQPGVGKSVLCSAVVNYLREYTQTHSGTTLAYFYFNYNDVAKQSFLGLLSSLVDSLAAKAGPATTAYEILSGATKPGSSTAGTQDLLAVLFPVLRVTGTKFIVVDALDECTDDDREETLLSFLKEIISLGDTGDVRVFVTSRPESDIKGFFKMHDICTHTESLHTDEHRNTLRRFISLELQKPKYGPERLGWSQEFRAQVARTLLEQSDDMFLWVDLQLHTLRHCPPSQVHQVLAHLPLGLYPTYDAILSRFTNDLAPVIRHVLECLVASPNPLPWEVVAEMFLLDLRELDSSTGVVNTLDSSQPLQEDVSPVILDHLPLVKRVSRHNGASVQDSDVVVFIHFTVQEYLLSSSSQPLTMVARPAKPFGASQISPSLYRTDRSRASSTLVSVLLGALESTNAPCMPNLHNYATKSWYKAATTLSFYSQTTPLALSMFLSFGSQTFTGWASHFWKTEEASDSPLHWAARVGLSDLVELFLRTHRDSFNQVDLFGLPPIFYAVLRGDIRTYTLLLGCQYEWDYLYPLQKSGSISLLHVIAAAAQESLSIHFPDFDTPLPHLPPPLWLWEQLPESHNYSLIYHTMWELMIQKIGTARRQLLSATDGFGCTPLMYLAQSNICAPQTICLLLDAGADAAARNSRGNTALHLAARRLRSPKLSMEHLLNHGAVIDAVNDTGSTPLLCLLMDDPTDPLATRLLLDAGADPNVCASWNQTALHLALGSRKYVLQNVEVLLSYGALPNLADKLGRTPLHMVCSINSSRGSSRVRLDKHINWVKVAEALLDAGADPNLRDCDGNTALDLLGRYLLTISKECRALDVLLRARGGWRGSELPPFMVPGWLD